MSNLQDTDFLLNSLMAHRTDPVYFTGEYFTDNGGFVEFHVQNLEGAA